MPRIRTFEEAAAATETVRTFESAAGEPKYAENVQEIFTLTDRLQKDPEIRQAYIRKYWKEQGVALSRQKRSPYFGNPVGATTHLLQTIPKEERARIQKEKSDEWQNEAKNIAIGRFFEKRTELANALWNQVHVENPEISDNEAYGHMHKHLEMYGYQPPGAGALPPLVMRDGQWESEYTPGWTEFRHGVVGVAIGTHRLVTGLSRTVGMVAEAITDWRDPRGGAYVTGTNPYREMRIKQDYQTQRIEDYLTRGMAENVPYMPEGFSPARIFGEQLPQFAITAGAAGLVKLGLVSKFMGRVITAANMFTLETPTAYSEYLRYAEEQGMDPRVASNTAACGAVAYGVVAGVLESYGPFEQLARTNPAKFGWVARKAMAALVEGGTEGSQSMTQFLIAYGLDLKKPEVDDLWVTLNETLAGMIMGPAAEGFTHQKGRTATPPQVAAPSTTIDPGEMGPVVDIPEVTPTVTPEVVQDVIPGSLTPDQVIDQMVSLTPKTEQSEITRPAFESVMGTLRYGQDAFVEIDVPIEQLDVQTLGQAESEARQQDIETYAKQPMETAPAIVAGSTDDSGTFTVIDGARRVQAAQQRGDTTVKVLVPQTDAQTVTPAVTPEVAPETRGRDRRGMEIGIERGEPPTVSTQEYIERQRTARQEWGETPEQIDEALRQDAQRMIEHAEEFGGTAEDIVTRKQRAQEVIDTLGKPTGEVPDVVTREADSEAKLVKKSVSLVQQKLGREGSKITDSKSLAKVGMAIAEIVGLDPEVDITWQFKTDPNLIGVAGLHQKLKDRTHKITIRNGTKYKKGAYLTEAMAKRKAQAGMKAGQITPSKSNIYRVVVHELGHIMAPPIGGEMGRPRKIHHDEFVKWVEEGVSKLIGTTYVEAPVVEPLTRPDNIPMSEDMKPVPTEPGEAPQTVGSVVKALIADEGGYLDTPVLAGALSGGVNVALDDIGSTWQGVKTLTDESAPLQKTSVGTRTMEIMDAAQSIAQTKIGEHNAKFLRIYEKLTTKEKRWMENFRDDGWTNWATLREHPNRLDAATVPQAVIALSQVSTEQQVDSARGAIEARLPQRRSDGTVGIFQPAKGGRYYRIMTPAGQSALGNQVGDVFEALLAWHQEHSDRNPDLPLTAEELKKVLRGEQKSGKTKQAGSLEYTRVFKELPTALKVNDKWVPILECRPVNHFMSSNESQWRRIAFWQVAQDRLLGPGRYQFGEYNDETGEYELPHPDNPELTDVDGLVDQLRTILVNEEASRKHGHPERVKRTFKRVLDNYFRQFQGGVMEEVFLGGDHHNRILQGIQIIDRNQMSSMLSFSGLWDLMQSTASTHIVGIKNLLEAHAKVLSNPKKYAAEYQAIGAVMLRHNDFMLRKTQRELTGGLLERGTAQVMMVGAEIAEKYAQTVTATAYDIWADRINGDLKDRQARELRIDLRLTDAEILEVARGEMSDATKAKIIQNGVKNTNYLAEDPMHRGLLQNNGLLRRMVPFTSVMSGSFRAADRIVAHLKEDVGRIKRGDKEATLDLIRNMGGMLTFIVGCYGRGFVQNMLRRLITGRPLIRPEEEDDWAGTMFESLGEGAVFGPYWRLFEAAKYSGGDPHRMAINMLPRVSIWLDTISALSGLGKYENTSWGRRMAKRGYEISPAARTLKNWYSNLMYPGRAGYEETRQRMRLFTEEQKKDPITQHAYAIFEAVRDQDNLALDEAVKSYKEWAKSTGRSSEEARTALRSALYARRPINLSAARLKEFLAGLTELQREQAEQQQREYTSWMDRVTRRPGAKRKRKTRTKRKKKQQGGDWYGTAD